MRAVIQRVSEANVTIENCLFANEGALTFISPSPGNRVPVEYWYKELLFMCFVFIGAEIPMF